MCTPSAHCFVAKETTCGVLQVPRSLQADWQVTALLRVVHLEIVTLRFFCACTTFKLKNKYVNVANATTRAKYNLIPLGKEKKEETNAFLAGCFVKAFKSFVPFFASAAFVEGFAFCSCDAWFAEQSSGAAAVAAVAAENAAAEVEVQVLRAAGPRWEEMSKSSLNLDMQRDDSIFHAPALANATTVVQRVAKTRVLRVV